jgi:intracellular sulfur oxidation DsrE/DsrF family protein
MNQEKNFSDEFLNAFVDNQLASDEKARAYIVISHDETLNRQVCELRKMRDLVQLAYRDIPAAPTRLDGHRPAGSWWRAGVAAAVVLAIGIAIGVQFQQPQTLPVSAKVVPAPQEKAGQAVTASRSVAVAARAKPTTIAAPAAVAPQTPVPTTVADEAPLTYYVPNPVAIYAGNAANKVLIHIAHDDNSRLGQALEEVEGLLRHYREQHQSSHVEVVINGRGLELVRRDTSRHSAQIARLQKEYDNLTFAACLNTIERLQNEQGIHVRLLPGVVVIDSGMAEIMRRQIQGWTYLQV